MRALTHTCIHPHAHTCTHTRCLTCDRTTELEQAAMQKSMIDAMTGARDVLQDFAKYHTCTRARAHTDTHAHAHAHAHTSCRTSPSIALPPLSPRERAREREREREWRGERERERKREREPRIGPAGVGRPPPSGHCSARRRSVWRRHRRHTAGAWRGRDGGAGRSAALRGAPQSRERPSAQQGAAERHGVGCGAAAPG